MRLLWLEVFSLICWLPAAACAGIPVQISEFAAAGHQGVRDEDGETPDWIELQNRSKESINLQGWTLSEESHRHKAWTLPATNLPPGQCLVVFASGKDRQVSGQPLHSNFKLPQVGGVLVLRDPAGNVSRVDRYPMQVAGVTFGLAGPSAVAAGQKVGMAAEYTYLAKPTPGVSNAAAIWLGPRIELGARQPVASPAFDEPIVVTARVSPVSGSVGAVRLSYRVMFGKEIQVPMLDDGQHGDGAAGDGVYGATVPARTAKPGQMVRYSVLAQDSEGRTARWPLFAERPDYSGYEGTVIRDPSLKTRLPVLQLFTDKSLVSGARRGSSPAALFYAGELYDHISVALHGQISRGFPKPSYNLDFPHDHHLRYREDRSRVKRIKLLANFADKSKIRNTLAYEMIAAAGSVGHFAFPVRVQQNGKFFSVAEIVENGDERWLQRVGRDPQGALYKMDENLSQGHRAEKKTRQYEQANDLPSLALALSEDRPIETRAAFAYRQIDLPQCISYFVAMALISSDDHGHKNYYLYRDSRLSGEWALLPWDVDLSWGRNWTGQYFNETMFVDNPLDFYRSGRHKPRNRLYNLFFEYPEFRQMYLRRLRTVMDELLQPPNTPAQSLIIEKRIRHWMDLLDPPDLKPSDADLDDAGGTAWGQPSSMRQEAQRIIDEYLPGRRRFLFESPRAKLFGDLIPPSQPLDATLTLSLPGTDLSPPEQYVRLTNTNAFAVDLTDWRLSGAGIAHTFRPGTVIPAGHSLYVVSNAGRFHRRPPACAGQPPFFVQGDWTGELKRDGGPLQLVHKDGHLVASGGQ